MITYHLFYRLEPNIITQNLEIVKNVKWPQQISGAVWNKTGDWSTGVIFTLWSDSESPLCTAWKKMRSWWAEVRHYLKSAYYWAKESFTFELFHDFNRNIFFWPIIHCMSLCSKNEDCFVAYRVDIHLRILHLYPQPTVFHQKHAIWPYAASSVTSHPVSTFLNHFSLRP